MSSYLYHTHTYTHIYTDLSLYHNGFNRLLYKIKLFLDQYIINNGIKPFSVV